MFEQLEPHLKVWSITGAAWFTSWSLEELNMVASILALICGAVASLSIAYFHIFKKEKK